METAGETRHEVVVRRLEPSDLEAVIAIDAGHFGRRREEYFKVKLQQNLVETGVKISLAAETDGCFAGFLLARVFYGEFGIPEPVAVLDTLAVHSGLLRRGVASALLRQLRTNLFALGVTKLQTEVEWSNQPLVSFFQREGFRPARRFCLDLDVLPDETEEPDEMRP